MACAEARMTDEGVAHRLTEDLAARDDTAGGALAALARDPVLSTSQVAADRVRMLLAGLPLALLASYATAAVLCWTLRVSFGPARIVAWLVALALVYGLRLGIWRAARAAGSVDAQVARWLPWLRLGVLASAGVWVALPLLLYPPSAVEQLVLALVLAAICAAAVSELAADSLSLLVFALPQILALALRLSQSQQAAQRAVGLLALVFAAYLVYIARKVEGTFLDISRLRARAANLLHFDEQTGLPNRVGLHWLLPQAVARARRRGWQLAVGHIDLNDFKLVNDQHGHAAGDRVLVELAQRLRAQLGDAESVAHLGSDEFVLVIENLDASRAAQQLAEVVRRVHRAVERPFTVSSDQAVHLELAMGVARYPVDAEDADALLRQADAAMYQVKYRKCEHAQWWQAGVEVESAARAERPIDPYGDEAAQALEQAQPTLMRVNQRFVDAFYEGLRADSEAQALLAALDQASFAELKSRQLQYLHMLTEPRGEREGFERRSAQLGTVHALTGVGASMLSRASTLYRNVLAEHLNSQRLLASRRYRLLRIVEARFQAGVQSQFAAVDQVQQAYIQALSRSRPAAGTLWADASQAELQALARLPGVAMVTLSRLGAEGELLIERSVGLSDGELADVLERRDWRPLLDASSRRGQVLTAVAWRTQAIQRIDSWLNDPRVEDWQPLARKLGVRCSLAVPFAHRDGHIEGVISIYGNYLNQFAAPWMQQWAAGIRRRWEALWAQCSASEAGAVVSEQTAQSYRDRLFSGGLQMYVQPIVDLQSGRVEKVEALARLAMPDGSMVSPGLFIPLLGDRELGHVFRNGLDLALRGLRQWEAGGQTIGVSLNLPPSTLLDPDCPLWVDQALRSHGVQAGCLTLELLETEGSEGPRQSEAMQRLRGLGVKLAMDDLGAGYSSIERLSRLRFDSVKIDQKLLRNMAASPLQTITMVGTMILLGLDLGHGVVVEGLETDALLEAAAILGAQHGQGYAIARPMPAQQFLAWHRGFELQPAGGARPIRTLVGALAHVWRHGRSGMCFGAGPEADCPLGAFLASQAAGEPRLQGWHATLHRPGEAADQAARRLMEWLACRIAAATPATGAG